MSSPAGSLKKTRRSPLPASNMQQQCAIQTTTLWEYYCDHKNFSPNREEMITSQHDCVVEARKKLEEEGGEAVHHMIWCRPGDLHGSLSQVETELLAVRREILEKVKDIKIKFNSPRLLSSFFNLCFILFKGQQNHIKQLEEQQLFWKPPRHPPSFTVQVSYSSIV